jgi:hypothetical protein
MRPRQTEQRELCNYGDPHDPPHYAGLVPRSALRGVDKSEARAATTRRTDSEALGTPAGVPALTRLAPAGEPPRSHPRDQHDRIRRASTKPHPRHRGADEPSRRRTLAPVHFKMIENQIESVRLPERHVHIERQLIDHDTELLTIEDLIVTLHTDAVQLTQTF